MTLRRKLATNPSEWNHPRWARFGMPVGAGLGALVGGTAASTADPAGLSGAALAGLGGGLGFLLAWVVLAALD